jgi:hypothetical protein
VSVPRKGTPEWRIHPGEILRDEFLRPMKMSVYLLAKELHVPAPRVNDIVLQKRDNGRYSGAAGKVFRNIGAVLAGAAVGIRGQRDQG